MYFCSLCHSPNCSGAMERVTQVRMPEVINVEVDNNGVIKIESVEYFQGDKGIKIDIVHPEVGEIVITAVKKMIATGIINSLGVRFSLSPVKTITR